LIWTGVGVGALLWAGSGLSVFSMDIWW
jgi:hypothetical protein